MIINIDGCNDEKKLRRNRNCNRSWGCTALGVATANMGIWLPVGIVVGVTIGAGIDINIK